MCRQTNTISRFLRSITEDAMVAVNGNVQVRIIVEEVCGGGFFGRRAADGFQLEPLAGRVQNRWTPSLTSWCAQARLGIVGRRLLEAGADPNLLRKDGHTPFSVAVVAGNLQVIREMVARGADLTADYNPHDNFPDPVESIMHIAAGNLSPPEIDEYLHALGVPLGSKNSMGEMPLDLADHQERHREAARTQKLEALSDPESLRRTAEQPTQTTDAIKKLLASH